MNIKIPSPEEDKIFRIYTVKIIEPKKIMEILTTGYVLVDLVMQIDTNGEDPMYIYKFVPTLKLNKII